MTNLNDIRFNKVKLKKIIKSLKKRLGKIDPEVQTGQLYECMAFSRGYDNWRDFEAFITKSGVVEIDLVNSLISEVIPNSGIEKYADESIPFESQYVLFGLQLYYNYQYINRCIARDKFYKDEREASLKVISDLELTALGELFFDEGIGANYDDAFYLFNEAALLGNPVAQSFLGDMYLDGLSVSKDPVKALQLYEKSLLSGLSEPRDNHVKIKRATLYLELGMEDKINYAIDYLTSKSKTYGAAAYELALVYMKGKYVSQDMTQIETLLMTSSTLGYFDATYMLALSFKQRNDVQMFLHILEGLAEKGFKKAIIHLGQIYHYGDVGVESNLQKAKPYCYQAALLGDSNCQNLMGTYYETGVAGEINHQLAFDWYTLAAESSSDYKGNADRVSRLLGSNRPATVYEIFKSLSDCSYAVNI